MANTFELIASSTVGATSVSNITFSSIPSTYTDLFIASSIRSDRVAVQDFGAIQFNADTGSNYSGIYIRGDGSAVISSTNGNATMIEIPTSIPGSTATASTFGSAGIYIPNYAGSNQKSVSFDATMENNATQSFMILQAGKWSGTAAISSIKLFSANGANFVQYSTAYLYGVKNA
jgi:hypothetical protein